MRDKPKRRLLGKEPGRLFVVSKLNIRFWLRLLGIFLVLDLLLVLTAGAGVVIYAERTLLPVMDELQAHRREDSDAVAASLQPLELAGISVGERLGYPQGARPLAGAASYMPWAMTEDYRQLQWDRSEGLSVLQRLRTARYILERPLVEPRASGGGPGTDAEAERYLRAALDLGPMIILLQMLLFSAVAVQALYMLTSISAGAKMIRGTMGPLVALAEKAQSLSEGSNQQPYTADEMEALAGKLENINAARLDTRIEVDAAQDDLRSVATAINGMLERIHASYRAQARFVSDASHELRTPISAIQGYANLLDRWGKHDPKALEESIAAIKSEAAHMKDLVEQLLFLARGDNHTLPLQRQSMDLGQLAEVVFKESCMIDEGHLWQSDCQSVMIFADPGLIKQALRILVDNAIKYTPADGRIQIRVFEQDGRAYASVQDEGIGIRADAVPRIFDRFYRADESRARATGGTGLGLSIAKWVVDRHGGRLEVLSREGIGTRMSMVLPMERRQKSGS